MAQTPAKTPPAQPKPASESVMVPGVPPPPHKIETEAPDEAHLPESTKAEMRAGREALAAFKDFNKAEYEAGRKALEEYNRTHSDS